MLLDISIAPFMCETYTSTYKVNKKHALKFCSSYCPDDWFPMQD